MSKLHHRLWVAISVSTLAIVSSCPVLAKPQPRSQVIVTSQADNRASVTDEYISPPPIEAILARVKVKPANQVKKVIRAAKVSSVKSGSIVKAKSTVRVKHVGRHVSADRSLKGISNLIDSDRVTPKYENYSAVNRLID
jgi:hypothetical protein